MEIELYQHPAAFAAEAQPFYALDPDRHTIALTALDAMTQFGEPATALATVHECGAVVGALMCSAGRPPIVSGVAPRHARAVVDALAAAGVRFTGARGPIPEADAFAAAHLARHGGALRPGRVTRLFALDTLVPPVGVPGAARPASLDDLDMVVAWRAAFVEEAQPPGAAEPGPSRDRIARMLVAPNGETLWEVDGVPVAQATARRPVAGMSRIGPVYTLPEHRRHGYAAAATAAATRWALDGGAIRVLLFTDLANATTNRLYPRLGYRPVLDAAEVDFVE